MLSHNRGEPGTRGPIMEDGFMRLLSKALMLALAVGLVPVIGAGATNAACIVEYKARKGPPLELHYGVIAFPDAACARKAQLPALVQKRIGRDGWTLLVILSARKGDPGRLRELRRRAGKYFLRY